MNIPDTIHIFWKPCGHLDVVKEYGLKYPIETFVRRQRCNIFDSTERFEGILTSMGALLIHSIWENPYLHICIIVESLPEEQQKKIFNQYKTKE